MSNIIRIKNASFYAYHGAMTEEQSIGGKFEIDVDIYTDFTKAAETDDLKETIDYKDVYNFIKKNVNKKKYYLIETLAKVLADKILENYKTALKVAVRVRKSNVPIGGVIDCVEAEVIKENGK
ncbi:MAG: dihydroneopterin aldolase [Ignavibacteria bacterium]|jgi:dihydroneopterin aldolase